MNYEFLTSEPAHKRTYIQVRELGISKFIVYVEGRKNINYDELHAKWQGL